MFSVHFYAILTTLFLQIKRKKDFSSCLNIKTLYFINLMIMILQQFTIDQYFKIRMAPRQIKKTTIKYETPFIKTNQQIESKQAQENISQERQRSREKIINDQKKQCPQQITVDVNSRKARLEAMKRARQLKQKQQNSKIQDQQPQELKIVLIGVKNQISQNHQDSIKKPFQNQQKNHEIKLSEKQQEAQQQHFQNLQNQQNRGQSSDSDESEKQQARVLHKPVFLSKQDRSQLHQDQQEEKKREEERKKKNLRYTTKLLLEQTIRKQQQENSDDQVDNTNDDEDQTNLPDDSDDKNQELEYEMWKIRELKRIRRDRQIRQKNLLQKAEIQRRRQMNNEQILLQNRLLGSDSTQQEQETKYNFMQKYYHVGAFYQDSSDPIFQRDYNLPTPLQMQDKSALPAVLQKRKGNFGKKGQSKYTHLTAQDTTDTNPLTRPDESLLNSWKKKMAGYKK